MYEATIKNHHLKDFEFRLSKIQPHIAIVRGMLSPYLSEINARDIYISGGCAAWLIGRTDTYDKINIHIYGRTGTISSNLVLISILTQLIEELPEPLTILYNNVHIRKRFKGKFMFPPLAVYINLFNTNKILTAECLCNYESNCLITQNNCFSHSRVVYPLLMDFKNEYNRVYYELDNEVKQIIRVLNTDTDGTDTINHFIPQQDIDRVTKIAKRLLTDPDLYPNRIMTFCDYKCSECTDRKKLTKKYADIWYHKTYAPGGKWSKAASLRFKGIDTEMFKQYCTCNH